MYIPKLAVWPDGYYMISQRDDYDSTTNNLDAWAFDRANMLNGNPATFRPRNSVFQNHHDIIALPSDLTGPPPPEGSPNFDARGGTTCIAAEYLEVVGTRT
jgi:hypothetical protein